MRFRFSQKAPIFPHYLQLSNRHHQRRRLFTSFLKKLQTTSSSSSASIRASFNGHNSSNGNSNSNNPKGNALLLPGATVATILMLGALHARRMYDDKKIEEAREKGIEIEFKPDVKASFLRMLPLRSISRLWGQITSVEIPVWLRPQVYRAWARAFHSNLDEVARPLEGYASLRDFFVRSLKEGSRPIDSDPCSLVSPVDGTILRFGELEVQGGMIEQVKGFSYSVSSLLGSSVFLTDAEGGVREEHTDQHSNTSDNSKKSWWTISLASPRVREAVSPQPIKGLYYCVLYLSPGDYHRVHSPVDWNVLVRRHFSGNLYPMNERATRTIRNLYVENERVVLIGPWEGGTMAMAAIGATNIGSIELSIEPELYTNLTWKKLLKTNLPEQQIYKPEGMGRMLKKGDEVAAFNMGSTVVLVFQNLKSDFRFSIRRGDKIRVGEALGRWHDS